MPTKRWSSLSNSRSIGSLSDSDTRSPNADFPLMAVSGRTSIFDFGSIRMRRLHAQQSTRTLSLSRLFVPSHQSPATCTTEVRFPFSSAVTGAAGVAVMRTRSRKRNSFKSFSSPPAAATTCSTRCLESSSSAFKHGVITTTAIKLRPNLCSICCLLKMIDETKNDSHDAPRKWCVVQRRSKILHRHFHHASTRPV